MQPFSECVCCMHGELRLVLAYLPAPTPILTPSLARLRASRAGGKRVGARLAGWHQSPGERGDEERQRETSACSIRKTLGGDSTHYFQPATEQLTAGSHRQTAWLSGICADGWETHRQCTTLADVHTCAHTFK